MKKLMLFFILGIFFISLTSAYSPHQINTTFEFSITSNNATSCNVSTMDYPSGVQVINQEMTQDIRTFNATINSSYIQEIGSYCWNVVCTDGTFYQTGSVCREVTGNGRDPPGDFTILGFSFLMLVIFMFIVVYIVKAVGHIIEMNFDLLDIAYSWGLYFALLGANRLANLYLGTLEIMEWLNLFVTILGFPMILIPVFAFFLSLFVTRKRNKKKSQEWGFYK